MELYECIKNRRSIRKFEDISIPELVIKKVVEAAVYAPSWKNSQVTRYYAVLNPVIKEKLVEAMPDFNQSAVQSAPVVLVSTVIKERSGYNKEGIPETSKGKGWQMYDCALSNMLLCLGAQEQGLGTVIMGYYEEDVISDLLEIPDTEEVVAVIAMGYPLLHPDMPKRKGTDVILKMI